MTLIEELEDLNESESEQVEEKTEEIKPVTTVNGNPTDDVSSDDDGVSWWSTLQVHVITLTPLSYRIDILKFSLAAKTHNFKWVKITLICLIWDQTFANLDV